MDYKVARWLFCGVALWQRGQESGHRVSVEWVCAASRKRCFAMGAATVLFVETIE
ncbi:hypothetical protein [Acidovorax sp. BoFeN1]|uniref:hypothetical protein n=1 Tax=Acidovorax sp. BoFeN1 TaxID=1231053 RepID=UPI0013752442|nr:hypothetical protein [Acidovorax sp. BoFeN1]